MHALRVTHPADHFAERGSQQGPAVPPVHKAILRALPVGRRASTIHGRSSLRLRDAQLEGIRAKRGSKQGSWLLQLCTPVLWVLAMARWAARSRHGHDPHAHAGAPPCAAMWGRFLPAALSGGWGRASPRSSWHGRGAHTHAGTSPSAARFTFPICSGRRLCLPARGTDAAWRSAGHTLPIWLQQPSKRPCGDSWGRLPCCHGGIRCRPRPCCWGEPGGALLSLSKQYRRLVYTTGRFRHSAA
mmetsp:Transcript_144105/g.375268  ORF Transcript_144105/g.375268 Transcript_144105/m.375268 type:complete len:243 (+) Transcript_144105:906-1634(+)